MARDQSILFLSDSNRYLQHDLYCQIAKNFPENLKSVFLASDFKADTLHRKSEDIDRKELEDAFSKFIEMPRLLLDRRPLTNPLAKVWRYGKNLRSKQNWRKGLLCKMDDLNPSLLILTSTNAENTRVISRYRPRIPKLYIQPCNFRVQQKGQYSISEKLKNFWFNRILRLPILPVKETTFDHFGKMHLALWSPLWKNHALERKESSFHFTGNPTYDQCFEKFSAERAYSKTAKVWIYLNKEKNSGQKNWDVYANFYREMMRIQPDFFYGFKAHPHSNLEKIQRAFPGAKVTKELVPKEKVDIMITHWSSTALEFIAEGIPTLLVNPDGQFDFSERYLDQYEGIARSIEEIKSHFKNYQEEGSKAFLNFRSNFVKRSLISDDGKSTERVIRLIQKLSRPE
ncbi:MAG: hypothetical protein CMI29_06265 [Opitutae bacterium]|nr:hypothetical protein [Opitutae bacterium]|tara:strand:+ start:20953 stop:22152 length:1200 start_codon:yes stop_codon:yes gene_type:complete